MATAPSSAAEVAAPAPPERPPAPASPPVRRPRRPGAVWRKWNRLIHRDLGYLTVGLTLVYAVSGIALNHARDWNPNYRVRSETVAFPGVPGEGAAPGTDAWAREALESLGLEAPYRGTFRPDDATVDVFVDGGRVRVDVAAGEATVELVQPRPLLRRARRLWTWMADLYAVALVLLALTGLFVLKGRQGITGRGAWLTGIGVALPLLFLLLYF